MYNIVKYLTMTSLHNKICEIFSDSRPIIIRDNKPYYVDDSGTRTLLAAPQPARCTLHPPPPPGPPSPDPLFEQLFKNFTDTTSSRRELDLVSLQTQFQNDIHEITIDHAMVPFNILEECFYPHNSELRGMYNHALAYALKVLIDMNHKIDQTYVLPEEEHGGYARGITPSQNVLFPRMIALAKVMKYYVNLHHHIRSGDLKIGGKKSRSKKRGRKSVHRRKKSSNRCKYRSRR